VEAEFNLRPEDLRAFAGFQWQRLQEESPRFVSAGFVFVIIAFLVVLVAITIGAESYLVGLLLGVFMSSLCWGMIVARPRTAYVLFPKEFFNDPRNQWVWATQRVTLGPEGVAVSSWSCRASHSWEAIWDVGVTEDHVFLCTSTKDAVVVPRRAFRDQQQYEEFVALARRYQKGARTSTAITAALPGETPARATAITRVPD
jgi:hypothetical protein